MSTHAERHAQTDKYVTARVRLPANMRDADQESVRQAVEHAVFALEGNKQWFRPPGFKVGKQNVWVVLEDAV